MDPRIEIGTTAPFPAIFQNTDCRASASFLSRVVRADHLNHGSWLGVMGRRRPLASFRHAHGSGIQRSPHVPVVEGTPFPVQAAQHVILRCPTTFSHGWRFVCQTDMESAPQLSSMAVPIPGFSLSRVRGLTSLFGGRIAARQNGGNHPASAARADNFSTSFPRSPP